MAVLASSKVPPKRRRHSVTALTRPSTFKISLVVRQPERVVLPDRPCEMRRETSKLTSINRLTEARSRELFRSLMGWYGAGRARSADTYPGRVS